MNFRQGKSSSGQLTVWYIALVLFCSQLYIAEGRISRELHHKDVDEKDCDKKKVDEKNDTPVFDVTKYGAKGDGKPNTDEYGECENTAAFMRAWSEACQSNGPAKVVIPEGKFMLGQVIFAGPCKGEAPLVELQGTMLAMTDMSMYPSPEWILFENVDGVRFTGTGTLDAQGKSSYSLNDCKKNPDCSPLPTTIKFSKTNNSFIEGIKSMNSMFYHVSLDGSRNVSIKDVSLTAPPDSPDTEGIHLAGSSLISIANSIIGTGAECLSLGPGSTGINVSGITCGAGLGISIAGLGKLADELGVTDVMVKNCTFNESTNGVSIKTLAGKVAAQISGITFEDLVMENVKSPITIDQEEKDGEESNVRIDKVIFKNIKGTAASDNILKLACSKLFPCDGVEIDDVDIKVGSTVSAAAGALHKMASCLNAKVKFGGNNDGLAC